MTAEDTAAQLRGWQDRAARRGDDADRARWQSDDLWVQVSSMPVTHPDHGYLSARARILARLAASAGEYAREAQDRAQELLARQLQDSDR